MTLYVVRAKPKGELMAECQEELKSGKISKIRPFGEELRVQLENARIHSGYAYWVEEDYCSPPLAMERKSVLDRYFEDITVEWIGPRRKGGIVSRTDPCFGSDIFYTSLFCLIERLKNIREYSVRGEKETNKI